MQPDPPETRARSLLHDLARSLALAHQERLSLTRTGRWTRRSLALLAEHTNLPAAADPHSERDAPGLSLVRALLGHAGLIGAVGSAVQLTDTAYNWLSFPPNQQLQSLRRLWLWNLEMTWHWSSTRRSEPALDSWWRYTILRTLQLLTTHSGWHRLDQLNTILDAQGLLTWDHTAQNLPRIREAMAWRIPAVLDFLFNDLLPGLALAEVQEEHPASGSTSPPVGKRALRLTPEGRSWLHAALKQQRYFLAPPPGTAVEQDIPHHEFHFSPNDSPPLSVTADLEVIIAHHAPAIFTFDITNLAHLTDPGPPAHYRVTRDSMHLAAAWGYPATDIHFILDRFSGGSLPAPAADQLHAWEQAATHIDYEPGYRLHIASPALLDALRRRKPFRRRTHPFASGQDAWVDQAQAKALFRYLRRRGHTLAPRDTAEAPFTWPPTRRPLPLHQLLVVLRTYGYLRRLVPGLAVLDLAPLETTLEAALPPGDHDALEQLLISQVTRLVEHIGTPKAVQQMAEWLETVIDLETLSEQVRQAIDSETALHLTYIDGHARITRRVVRPCRQEERWGRQYLLAYCEQRRAERHFRLDRIIRLEPA